MATERSIKSSETEELRNGLAVLEERLSELKIQYDQYFLGLLPLAPEKLHYEVKHFFRKLRKAPFKNSVINYKLRTLETRFQTLNSYWQRVLKEREEGRYCKDVFKSDLRERNKKEQEHKKTREGKVEDGMQGLFLSYKKELERVSGQTRELDFEVFKKNLISRAKDLKLKQGVGKLTFKIVVQDGKVLVRAVPLKV